MAVVGVVTIQPFAAWAMSSPATTGDTPLVLVVDLVTQNELEEFEKKDIGRTVSSWCVSEGLPGVEMSTELNSVYLFEEEPDPD